MIKPTRIVKYVAIGLGFFICLIGGAFVVEGILVRLNSGFFSNEAVTLLNRINFPDIQFGYTLLAMVYIMIGSGVITMVTGIVGIYGAARKTKRFLRLFVLLAVVLLLVHGTMVGFWLYARHRTNEWLKGEMLQLLGDYKGPESNDEVSVGWNKLFMQARCCGVNDQLSDGVTTSDFDLQHSIWHNTNANSEVVPATCCHGSDSDDFTSNINSACTTTPVDYYTKGCYEDLNDLIHFNSVYVFCLSGTLLLMKILGIFSSCLLMDESFNRIVPFFMSKG